MQQGNDANALGVDVSQYQGQPDWDGVKAAGKSFAVCRVTYGTHEDPELAYNYRRIKSAGLVRGTYHFAAPGLTSSNVARDAQTQAAVFLAAVDRLGGIVGGDLPPALDLAGGDGSLAPEELVEWCAHWMDDVHAAVKNPRQQAILYADYGTLQGLGSAVDRLGTRGQWIARWDRVGSPPDIGPWTRWTMWQYSGQGSVAGISGPVDLDEWHTTLP